MSLPEIIYTSGPKNSSGRMQIGSAAATTSDGEIAFPSTAGHIKLTGLTAHSDGAGTILAMDSNGLIKKSGGTTTSVAAIDNFVNSKGQANGLTPLNASSKVDLGYLPLVGQKATKLLENYTRSAVTLDTVFTDIVNSSAIANFTAVGRYLTFTLRTILLNNAGSNVNTIVRVQLKQSDGTVIGTWYQGQRMSSDRFMFCISGAANIVPGTGYYFAVAGAASVGSSIIFEAVTFTIDGVNADNSTINILINEFGNYSIYV